MHRKNYRKPDVRQVAAHSGHLLTASTHIAAREKGQPAGCDSLKQENQSQPYLWD